MMQGATHVLHILIDIAVIEMEDGDRLERERGQERTRVEAK